MPALYEEVTQQFDEKMEFALVLNLKTIICAPDPDHTTTDDDWKIQADQLNALAMRVQKAGFRLGYHNHDLEFIDVNGQTPYDILMSNTDPTLVKFQIDVGNLTFVGKDCYCILLSTLLAISQCTQRIICREKRASRLAKEFWIGREFLHW